MIYQYNLSHISKSIFYFFVTVFLGVFYATLEDMKMTTAYSVCGSTACHTMIGPSTSADTSNNIDCYFKDSVMPVSLRHLLPLVSTFL